MIYKLPKASEWNVKFRSHCLKVKTECIQIIIISLKHGQQHDLSISVLSELECFKLKCELSKLIVI